MSQFVGFSEKIHTLIFLLTSVLSYSVLLDRNIFKICNKYVLNTSLHSQTSFNLVTNYWTHFYAAFTSNCTGLTKSNDE